MGRALTSPSCLAIQGIPIDDQKMDSNVPFVYRISSLEAQTCRYLWWTHRFGHVSTFYASPPAVYGTAVS